MRGFGDTDSAPWGVDSIQSEMRVGSWSRRGVQRDVGPAGSRAAGGGVSPPDGHTCSPVPTMAQGMTVGNGPLVSGPEGDCGPPLVTSGHGPATESWSFESCPPTAT